ncbi:nucleotidyl transferase AbiEii/AbiGii toxin family protein [Streptomyces sp. NPDC051219]|uniref:nucleotidyl transferase AbiEii/AbiGii toxin family protein n=1 Tax=Streptomyces sp. NPDC051219 TaxID=3155283 RepID=UPI003441EC73
MSGAWERFGWAGTEVPSAPLDDQERRRLDLPRTLRPVAGDGVTQRPVFDPALKHFSNAYRAADPGFGDPVRDAAWRVARREALHVVLAAIADSQWVDSLVLRGSVLLADWFGEAAREPGDLDFVVTPADWHIGQGRTERMLDGIATAAQRTAERLGTGLSVSASGAVSEDIWAYDRVPGRRMVLPWSAPGLPAGQVQLDFVFNERLPLDPGPTEVAGAVLLAATPELSLAWKVMWLVSDMHPQGKDLYDAVLLAERYPLRYQLLDEVFRLVEADPYPGRPVEAGDVEEIGRYVEWEHFRTEYPHVPGDGQDYAARLVAALASTFAS